MGRDARSAKNNIYYKARIEASGYNEKLKSRESAAEMLGVHASTLADYELGIVKCPQPDKVVLMADLYNAPELLNRYCTDECPIGCSCVAPMKVETLDRVTIKTLSAIKSLDEVKNELLDITSDGDVDDSEHERFIDVMDTLEQIVVAAGELRLWFKKNRGRR
ncbi:helix-turn-helix domain-containing protein [Peptoniphilus indolicus]|uniref:XRE family transcriptional regulator n=2 Tax=Peptoniphilus indolicus TaxID=33030 RepID=G4D5J7_9FIRM|nr:helix-turn-helix transcriptional regulator [Peptoniphilus indolicus]EGY78663.1 XRE family transcriptional regulator [Peptoniphilus indolicus ATCC 29427]SUB74416.1 Helix-turn-helix [Peptoniphilus indolicus]